MTDEKPGQLWEMGIYGEAREESQVTGVGIRCGLSALEVAQLPIGATIEMTVVHRRLEGVVQR